MGEEHDLGGLEVDNLDSVIEVFVDWAGGTEAVRLLHTPDVLLAVETPTRRGFLLDEIYFATLWADRGRAELWAAVHESLAAIGKEPAVSGGLEPDPHGLVEAAMRHGRNLP